MRALLREFVLDLHESQLWPPHIATINPPLWEAAHVAWFAEWFCVRDAYNTADGQTRADVASIWPESDAFLNSNTITHAARWHLPQLTRASTLNFLDRSLEATLRALERVVNDEKLDRLHLTMFHEAMHLEALAWAAQTLSWKAPSWARIGVDSAMNTRHNNNVHSAPFQLGESDESSYYQFDNESGFLPQFDLALGDSAELVTNREFAQFVECDAYAQATQRAHPVYWRSRANGGWEQRRFDRWIPLAEDEPVVHVSAQEAEAYATWKGARLPSEAELHSLFSSQPNLWHGHVWEWTSTPFAPYVAPEHFKPGLYREYSQPWFDGKHRVLRGGSFATLPIMHHPHYRNFFTPKRSDVFAGFRVIRE